MKRTRDADITRFRRLWEDEVAGIELYRRLAEAAEDDQREILLDLAAAEERHAAHWEKLLHDRGVTHLKRPRTPARVRVLAFVARRFGPEAVLPAVLRLEASDADKYDQVAEAPSTMASDEREHGRRLASLQPSSVGNQIARSEQRHRAGAGGALRAAVFGFNDGLVSNVSLVMGVAGGSGGDLRVVLLAGIAGLLAGAFSMAAGEWVSVRSQRELYEREIEIEAEELNAFPEEEQHELALIYRAKGVDRAAAERLAAEIMRDPNTALDTLAREELGLDPADLGSPWVAAGSSFTSFALGAIVPVLPLFFSVSQAALFWAAGLAGVALFLVGAALSIFTGRGPLLSGARLVLIGTLTAGITFAVGTLIGVGVA